MTTKRRRVVNETGETPIKGRPALWAFGYRDFAVLFDCSESALRNAVHRGVVDLGSLSSIVDYYNKRNRGVDNDAS